MKHFLLVVSVCFAAAGCSTIRPLEIPKIGAPAADFERIAVGESEATFALSKLVQDVDRGRKIMAFPSSGYNYGGNGAYCNYQGGSDLTWLGGKRMFGNWSTELGEEFYDAFSGLGYSVAGDPTDLFNQQYSVNSSEYLIGGRLTDIRGNYCHKHHWWDGRALNLYSGETYIKIEWSVLNTLTKNVIITKTTEGYGLQEEPILDGVYSSFSQAFIDSSERFASEDALRAIAIGERILPIDGSAAALALTTVYQGEASTNFSIDEIGPYVVTIRVGAGHGSGVIVGKNGYVVTNSHVVGNAKSVQIIMSTGLEVEGRVVAVSKERDVALVKTPLKIRKPISINLDLPKVGSEIYAVGSPLEEHLSLTVTKGITSAIRKDPASGNLLIQGDAAISPGNSGGPLVSGGGSLIGISVASYVGRSASGLHLFIPVREAFEYLNIELAE